MQIIPTSHDCPQIDRLLQTYEKEFSPITGKLPGCDGRYELDVDLTQTSNYLCHLGEDTIGFCIKGTTDGRHDILEFFIAPEMRSSGCGEKLAHGIFSKYKGAWQVRQIEGADKARAFWRKSIHSFTDGSYQEELIEDPYWGQVTRQTFTST